ncbi:hypothetical protein [Streptosporangium sandarakinum]|uniref:hypothetical protein n=1 Tax=Streptosporangium sandarakinum TaxID=1260955 RepID=UPI00371DCD3F
MPLLGLIAPPGGLREDVEPGVQVGCRALAALVAVPRMCAGRDDAQTRFLVALAGG